jgi:hypothetical protein
MEFLYAFGGFVAGALVGWTTGYFYGKPKKMVAKALEKASKQ